MSQVTGTVAAVLGYEQKIKLLSVDNFAHEAMEIRERALAAGFGPFAYKGCRWEGVGLCPAPDMAPFISAAIGESVTVRLAFFRLGMAGIPMSTFIHADNTEAEFAGVLHLSDPKIDHGGTAFWRHKGTGWREAPTVLDEDIAAMLAIDGQDETKWDRESCVEAKFNRFVTYPARCFHSRYPNQCDAPTKEEGRLVLACFYDRA